MNLIKKNLKFILNNVLISTILIFFAMISLNSNLIFASSHEKINIEESKLQTQETKNLKISSVDFDFFKEQVIRKSTQKELSFFSDRIMYWINNEKPSYDVIREILPDVIKDMMDYADNYRLDVAQKFFQFI
jgi:hypothetical protein